MKKIISLALSAVCALSFVGCGLKLVERGETLSAQEATRLIDGIKAKTETFSAQDITKMTSTLKLTMDEQTSTMTQKFSKEDHYLYYSNDTRDMELYDGYEDAYKEYLGTIHHSVDTNYLYIDEMGRLIDASSSYVDETKQDHDGIWRRTQDSSSFYSVRSETLEEAEKLFHNNILTQASDLIAQLLMYSSQMIQTFEPLIETGSFSMPGMEIEIRSNGEGHLYMKENLSSMGMYYECEYKDYMLTYAKTVMDNTKTGLTATGYKTLTTEVFYQFGVCELTYPNLSNYKQLGV